MVYSSVFLCCLSFYSNQINIICCGNANLCLRKVTLTHGLTNSSNHFLWLTVFCYLSFTQLIISIKYKLVKYSKYNIQKLVYDGCFNKKTCYKLQTDRSIYHVWRNIYHPIILLVCKHDTLRYSLLSALTTKVSVKMHYLYLALHLPSSSLDCVHVHLRAQQVNLLLCCAAWHSPAVSCHPWSYDPC